MARVKDVRKFLGYMRRDAICFVRKDKIYVVDEETGKVLAYMHLDEDSDFLVEDIAAFCFKDPKFSLRTRLSVEDLLYELEETPWFYQVIGERGYIFLVEEKETQTQIKKMVPTTKACKQ